MGPGAAHRLHPPFVGPDIGYLVHVLVENFLENIFILDFHLTSFVQNHVN